MFLTLLLITFVILGMHVRYPFIYKHQGKQFWSVGIAILNSENDSIKDNVVSVLSPEFIKKETGYDGVADPWLVKEADTYFLFIEVMDGNLGKLGVFLSKDLKKWEYGGEILKSDYHLSYPQIIKNSGKTYMLPETSKAKKVTLCESDSFPLEWKVTEVLLDGIYLDSTHFEWEGVHYLLNIDPDYECHVFYSDQLLQGEWLEHPKSPLGIGNRLRPAGRPRIEGDQIVIPVQCRRKGYGSAVYSLVLSNLSKTHLKFKKGPALLKPLRNSLFSAGIHHVDYIEEQDRSIVVFDGRAGTQKSYRIFNYKKSIRDNIYDFITFFRLSIRFSFLRRW